MALRHFPVSSRSVLVWFTCLSLVFTTQLIAGRRSNKPITKPGFDPSAEKVDLFDGIENGSLEVRMIAANSKKGNLLIENKSDKPLTVKMPDAFVGVQVLKQYPGGGGGGGGQSVGGGGGGGGGFGGGGGGQSRMLLSRLAPLHLDEEKQKHIQEAISESFAEMFRSGSTGSAFGGMPRQRGGEFDRSEMSQRIDNMLDRVLQQHLTSEQLDLYRQTRNRNRNIRRGEIWLQDENGDPVRQPIMLGISDDEYTEILNSDLEPGTVVITRIREKKI